MKRLLWRIAILSILAMVPVWMGCDEEDDPYITSDDFEITRYLEDSEDGVELYTTSLFPDEPVYIDDSTQIFYEIDSVSRSITIDYGTSGRDFYGYDNIATAVADVDDILFGTAYKIINGDTTEAHPLTDNIARSGYFLKLYNDNYNYRGWRFWGYSSSLIIPRGTFTVPNLPQFSTDPPETLSGSPSWVYFEKNQIVALAAGDSITFVCDEAANIFAPGVGGISGYGPIADGGKYKAGWRLPATDQFYHLIYVDMPWVYKVDTTFISNDPPVLEIDTAIIKSGDPIVPYKASYL